MSFTSHTLEESLAKIKRCILKPIRRSHLLVLSENQNAHRTQQSYNYLTFKTYFLDPFVSQAIPRTHSSIHSYTFSTFVVY
jgi:hypothetical protein